MSARFRLSTAPARCYRLGVETGTASCFAPLAADRLRRPPFARLTSPLKTRVQGFCRGASGRFSSRLRRSRAIATGCGACGYKTASGRGKWPNRDPIGEAGGINLYGFVGNDPIDRVDPLGERWPDYYYFNINIAIPNPWTATLVSWSGTLSLDRNGNFYWSPIGASAGKSATIASCSLTANWLNQFSTPTPQQLNSFLTANGVNVGAGFIGGASESYTPGSGWATGVGLFTPQGGGGWNYSFPLNQPGYGGHGAGSSW